MNYEDLSNLTRASDNIEELLCVFPTSWRKNFDNLDRPLDTLIEFVVDLGRLAMARFQDEMCPISDQPVEYGDLDYIASYVSQFSSDNRAGIDATLHRISAIRNRHGRIVGLTARVGRAVYGDADIIKDIIKSGRSILLLGQPGVGKTTVLREISRVLADELKQRVVIVDTSNEIAGDGDIPHPGVGSARRLQVADPALQHNVMIEAVENHTPQVVVIDEIGTEAEAYAARTIAERGVVLVATAHGTKLDNLIQNPTLCDLVGGIESVTLSDEMAFKRGGGHKAILERKAPPTFEVVIELRDRHTFAIHKNVANSVDAILRGAEIAPLVRVRRVNNSDSANRADLSEDQKKNVCEDNKSDRLQKQAKRAAASGVEPALKEREAGGRTDSEDGGKCELASTALETSEGDIPKKETLSSQALYGTLLPHQELARSEGAQAQSQSLDARFSYLRKDRYIDSDGNVLLAEMETAPKTLPPGGKISIYPMSVSRSRLEKLIGLLELPAQVVTTWKSANVVLALENSPLHDPYLFKAIRKAGVEIHFISENSWLKIKDFLDEYFQDTVLTISELAKIEAQEAIEEVLRTGRPYNLLPQERGLRHMQGQMAAQAGLKSMFYGLEPECYLRLQS